MIETVMIHHVARHTTVNIGPRAEYAVTPEQLDAYLERRSTWTPVSSISDLERGDGRRRFLITFDDGYRNNLTNALPVLESHGVPCILFVTTGFVDGKIYPYELELACVIKQFRTLYLPNRSQSVLVGDEEEEVLYQKLRRPLKAASHAQREAFMEGLAQRNKYRRTDFQRETMLSWKEVKTLSQHPLVMIGAHTHTHLLLHSQWWRTAFQEIRHSRDELEARLECQVSVISYPYGGHSFAVRRFVQALGFEYAFTTESRHARQIGWHNRFSIPRVDISRFTRT